MLTLKLPSSLGRDFESVQLIDLRSWLPVNPNYTWAQLAGIRPIESLNTIVCHHDAISKAKTTQYSDTELARRIAVDHINSKKNHPKGDAGFPYDVWIRNGIIYWCNDIEAREYGVASNNGYTVNVCVSGEYAYTDQLTDADRKALYVAILLLKECLPNDKHIKAHKELSPTACPGYDINKVKEEVATLELSLALQDTPNDKLSKATVVRARTEDLYKIASDPKNQYSAEGLRKMNAIYDIMIAQGLIKVTQPS